MERTYELMDKSKLQSYLAGKGWILHGDHIYDENISIPVKRLELFDSVVRLEEWSDLHKSWAITVIMHYRDMVFDPNTEKLYILTKV